MRCKANAQSQIYQKWMTDCDEQKHFNEIWKETTTTKTITINPYCMNSNWINSHKILKEFTLNAIFIFLSTLNSLTSYLLSVFTKKKNFFFVGDCISVHFLFYFLISEILLQIFVCFVFFVSLKSSSYGCAMYYVTISE